MSENYVKKYDVGQIKLDLPYANYIHELPLLSFGDVQNTLDLYLIFQSKLTNNPFYIANGYKLSIQKRIIIPSNGTPQSYEDGNGTLVKLNCFLEDKYAFDDGSQRFIRLINGQYILENPDYSTEIFDTNGNILFIKDKYSNTILEYKYSSERLTSVIFKENKTISFGYSDNVLEYIEYSYSNKTYRTTLSYSGNDVIVHHYSGVDYHLNYTSGDFEVYSPNHGERITVNTNSNNITVNKYFNDNVIHSAIYEYIDFLESGEANIIDITNFHNVTTRVQFIKGKPSYSYETFENMFLDHPETNNYYYPGKVTFYNNEQAIGSQGYGDDLAMECITSPHYYDNNRFRVERNLTGLMTVSGWLKSVNNRTSECDVTVKNGNTTICTQTVKGLRDGIWMYFTISFYAENADSIIVVTSESNQFIIANDFRLSGHINSDTNLEEYKDNLIKSSGVLFYTDNDGVETVIPITDSFEYINNGTSINKTNYPITINDLMKYKINYAIGKNTGEIYYNDGRGALRLVGAFYLRYRTPEGTTISVPIHNLAIGKMYTHKNNEYITKANFYTENGSTKLKIQSFRNSREIASKIYNDKLDLIESTVDGITTQYERDNNGLLQRQNTENIIQREFCYDDSNCIKITDEFGITTTYTINDTWGVVTASTVDGTSVTDTFDGDCSTLKSKTFSKNAEQRTHIFSHENGMLSGLSDGTINYGFNYIDGDLSSITKNGTSIESYTISNDRETFTSTFGSHSVEEIYDKYGRLSEITDILKNTYDVNPVYNSEYRISNIDNGNAKLAISEDQITGNITKYAYSNGNLSKIGVFNEDKVRINDEVYTYDNSGRLVTDLYKTYITDANEVKSNIVYISEEDSSANDDMIKIYSYSIRENQKVKTENSYDTLNRIESKIYTFERTDERADFTKKITYTKTRPTGIENIYGTNTLDDTEYEYDDMGRIISINNGETITYTYDSYGQLETEVNNTLDKTFQYEYNGIGNIKSVKVNGVTTSFAYDDTSHPDRLTSYKGKDIDYNETGCPTSYDGKTLAWTNGKLTKIDSGTLSSGRNTYDYKYNALGQRVEKSFSYMSGRIQPPGDFGESEIAYLLSSNTKYYYDHSGRLIAEYCVENHSDFTQTSNRLEYLYDESGMIGFNYTASGVDMGAFYFQRNLQGDVVGIYNTSGTKIVEYRYDAYGNCTVASTTTNYDIALTNPIRYRGYYFDQESGWYFLNARYYSPEWRRFISPDDTSYLDPESVNGLNLYCYCGNDPVNYCDPSGHMPEWLKWLIGGVAFTGAVVLTAVTGGALAPVFVGMASSVVLGGLAGGVTSYLQGEDFWSGFADGSANGAMWGGLSLLGGAAIRTFNIFNNGVVIGENMTRVKTAAKQLGGVQTYAGTPGFKIIKAIKGEAYATTKALAHNKAWLTRMMNWGVKVYDIGIDINRTIGRSPFYAMENALVNSYFNMIPCYLI